MTPEKSSMDQVVNVNAKLLSAFLLGGTAWWLWPSTPELWGLALPSILISLSASGKLVAALKAIRKTSARVRVVSTLKQDSIEPKSSSLISEDELRKAGMIE